MLTVIRVWLASSLVLGIVMTADQLRRPRAAWEAAGRERRFWVALTIASGFHGLGPFSAVAYVTAVLPRFRAAAPAGPRASLQRLGSAAAVRPKARTAVEVLVLVAGILIFASSFIHAAVIVDHFEYWVPFGVCFAIVTCAQAAWVALVYREPRNRRVLVAGAVGNGVLVVVWVISRIVGVPFGPDPWRPEPVGTADALSTLDELAAIVLVAIVLAASRGSQVAISRIHLRLAPPWPGRCSSTASSRCSAPSITIA